MAVAAGQGSYAARQWIALHTIARMIQRVPKAPRVWAGIRIFEQAAHGKTGNR